MRKLQPGRLRLPGAHGPVTVDAHVQHLDSRVEKGGERAGARDYTPAGGTVVDCGKHFSSSRTHLPVVSFAVNLPSIPRAYATAVVCGHEAADLAVAGEFQRAPVSWQAWIKNEAISVRAKAGEPKCKRLPQAPHRREMETATGGTGEVVEIEPSRDPQCFKSGPVAPGSSKQAGMNGR
jgi:hypothetical protein